MLLKNEDYKLFQADKFKVVDEDNNTINMVTNSNVTNNDYRYAKININSIKEKFKALDLTYEQIFEFYSKLSNKTIFYHNNMMLFNLKQIRLESNKDR